MNGNTDGYLMQHAEEWEQYREEYESWLDDIEVDEWEYNRDYQAKYAYACGYKD